jgi:hypothetical protein
MPPAARYLLLMFVVGIAAAPLLLAGRVAPLGCPLPGAPGQFLAFCRNGAYQDFEHGAYALKIRPAAVAAAQRAAVLFLGNSRLELGFSTTATAERFAAAGHDYYLLGFGFGETDRFAAELFHRLDLHPQALVIDVDPFFDGALSEPAQFLLDQPIRAGLDYRAKAAGVSLLRAACSRQSNDWPCGGAFALWRDDATGAWEALGPGLDTAERFDPGNGKTRDPGPFVAEAQSFLAQIGMPAACVVLTTVPTPQRSLDAGTVKRIADALGAAWVEPSVPDLASFDRSHLTRDSAERWSAVFLQAAMPVLDRCLSHARVLD